MPCPTIILGIGIRPGKIEHEFAPRVVFEVERHAAHGATRRILEHEMACGPTGARRRAARLFERQQEFVAQKGLSRPRKRIPALGIDFLDAREKSRASGLCGHAFTVRRWLCDSLSRFSK